MLMKRCLAIIAICFVSAGLSAQTIDIPDGSLTVNPDGSFLGTRTETNYYGGNAPSTTDTTEISGQIGTDGSIAGTFSGTDTHVELNGNGPEYTVYDVSGTISGNIDANGNFSVSWTGPEPGSERGTLPGYTITAPAPPTPSGNSDGDDNGPDPLQVGQFGYKYGGRNPRKSDNRNLCGG